MKFAFAFFAAILASTSAYADGFVCQNDREQLEIKVYNHTDPKIGTRTGAVMVLSDTSVQPGRRTIARFTDLKGTLDSRASVYLAKVDHRFTDSRRKGELIGGTKIGYLKQVILDLDFSYTKPLQNGAPLRGDLILVKRNGQETSLVMSCVRYLKN